MPREDLDPFAILAALGVTDATAATPVSGGQDTRIWRVLHGGTVSALRVFRAEQTRAYRREVIAMHAAADGDLPVPEVRAEGTWEGRPALLLSWCAGRPLLDAFKARPWRIWLLGVQFGRMQARIHAIRVSEEFQIFPGFWLDWAGPLDPRLRERLLATTPRADSLLHLDYHPLNVMTDGARMTAVLDWPNALAGDPRADLARTAVLMRFTPGVRLALLEKIAARLFLRAWWRGYRQVAGRVTEMAPFYAWAGAATVRDQSEKIGRPGIALQSADLDPLRQWTARWMRRAGL